ncbi:MAG: hypothetical protein ACXWK3_23050 [Reyranella sp.]
MSDVLDRRFMLTLMPGLNIGALLTATVSQNFFTFALAGVLIGLSCSAVMADLGTLARTIIVRSL